jgi:hypothetical protein
MGSSYVAQKYRRMFVKFKLSNLACNQIWLNLHVDHHHFRYIITTIDSQKNSLNTEPKLLAQFV